MIFKISLKRGGGYGKLAQLYEATLVSNPATIYTQLSQENKADPALGNLGTILMAMRMPTQPEVMASLESLSAPNNPWGSLALELLALSDIKRGDSVKAAERYLRLLKQPNLTPYEKARVGMMLSQIDIPSSLLEKIMKEEEQK